MWGLIKDLPAMVRELWSLLVPGLAVGAGLGYFLTFWPVVTFLTISALIVIAVVIFSVTDSGPNAGEGGGILIFFFGVLCFGVFAGLLLTAMFVDTIHVSMIPVPTIEINWSWLFR